jgi:DNA-binding NarL/FixJ family response regulator
MTLRLVLADDHEVVRKGCRALLEREGFEVLGEAADGFEAVRLVRSVHPDVAVLDYVMPEMTGLDAAEVIFRGSPTTAIVILSMYVEEWRVLAALRSGIRGYVAKSDTSADLVQAIRTVARGGLFLSRSTWSALIEAFLLNGETPPDPLLGEERAILRMIAEGKTTSDIAEVLHVGTQTAASYRAALMNKLHVHDIQGLVRYAIRRGVIEPAVAWFIVDQILQHAW